MTAQPESRVRRPIALYLDTSDLSYLVKGRGPAAAGDVIAARGRLEALLRDGSVRLFVSFVHLAEMALDKETSDAALAWLDAGTPVGCFMTSAEAIFRAELLGEPLAVNAEPLARDRILSLRLPLRGPLPSVPGASVARAFSWVAAGLAGAESLSKRAARRPEGTKAKGHAEALREQRRIGERVLRGEHHDLPLLARVVAALLMPIARSLGAWHGLTLDDVRAHQRLPAGCSWFAGTVRPETWRAAAKRVGSPRDAPASALRVAIEASRPTQPSALYDVQHLAYAARCDFATIDGPNFRATTKVRGALTSTVFFPTGHLADVVGAVESAAAAQQ